MAAAKLPYMTSPGVIPKILAKMQEARRPDRFTQDFLANKLGHSGGGSMPIIPLLKRMGFLASDGTPTPLYDRFRDPATQGAAVAEGMRTAYSELFDRSVYAGDLSKDKVQALIMEVTGGAKDDRTVEFTLSTFWALKQMADFEASLDAGGERAKPPLSAVEQERQLPVHTPRVSAGADVGLNLAYTINLVLPETTNPDVFAAIFRSLKENLLRP
ncbi:DUF5343 domain-containing protein [Terricaulis silvestris]|uniref:DUF5343 domain-containing protein n=1 Tax=Terricaulis silvestris TaxID=2686094 RepID=A0A6I6MKV9_9CAUL|nr:DUF5343 domain-containing protein [Terricaulis silvestris]QGZ93267.1 hypothetical protein DSM104635_00075 [Terricaulis silvestris]